MSDVKAQMSHCHIILWPSVLLISGTFTQNFINHFKITISRVLALYLGKNSKYRLLINETGNMVQFNIYLERE